MKTPKNKKQGIKFWKYESEGNDFIITNDSRFSKLLKKKTIAGLCHRQRGIGANGLIFMSYNKQEWSWRFYNEDGTTPKMCGNGAKCVGLWLKNHGYTGQTKQWSWNTKLGKALSLYESKKRMWVQWPMANASPDTTITTHLHDILDGLNERGLAYISLINTGIPHLVLINHESWTSTDRVALNEQLRHHPIFGKEGTNVTWHSLKTKESVTFERGVEAETMACGTGAIAIHKALCDYGKASKTMGLKFPGGTLFVKLDSKTGYWLGGHPREVFSGELNDLMG